MSRSAAQKAIYALLQNIKTNRQAFQKAEAVAKALLNFSELYQQAFPPSLARPLQSIFNKKFHHHKRNIQPLDTLIQTLQTQRDPDQRLMPAQFEQKVRQVLCAYLFHRVPYDYPHSADTSGIVFEFFETLTITHLDIKQPNRHLQNHQHNNLLSAQAMRISTCSRSLGMTSVAAIQAGYHRRILRKAFPSEVFRNRNDYAAKVEQLTSCYQQTTNHKPQTVELVPTSYVPTGPSNH